jgi:hypothetical protein
MLQTNPRLRTLPETTMVEAAAIGHDCTLNSCASSLDHFEIQRRAASDRGLGRNRER